MPKVTESQRGITRIVLPVRIPNITVRDSTELEMEINNLLELLNQDRPDKLTKPPVFSKSTPGRQEPAEGDLETWKDELAEWAADYQTNIHDWQEEINMILKKIIFLQALEPIGQLSIRR